MFLSLLTQLIDIPPNYTLQVPSYPRCSTLRMLIEEKGIVPVVLASGGDPKNAKPASQPTVSSSRRPFSCLRACILVPKINPFGSQRGSWGVWVRKIRLSVCVDPIPPSNLKTGMHRPMIEFPNQFNLISRTFCGSWPPNSNNTQRVLIINRLISWSTRHACHFLLMP